MGNGEVRKMILNSKTDDLSILFKLFKKHAGGEDIVYKCFSNCLQEEGRKVYQEDEVAGAASTGAFTNSAMNIIKV